MRFFQRHWNGEYALPVSFFGISVICTIAIFSYAKVVERLVLKWAYDPQRALALCLISLALIWAVTIWHYGGTLRAARFYRDAAPGRFRTIMAGAAITLVTLPLVPVMLTSRTLSRVGAAMAPLVFGL